MLSKLAIKKQVEPVSGKIEVEEVRPAGKTESETDRRQTEADAQAEAAEMKLPHRKAKPRPSSKTPPRTSKIICTGPIIKHTSLYKIRHKPEVGILVPMCKIGTITDR